jgi:hypothetical protein
MFVALVVPVSSDDRPDLDLDESSSGLFCGWF